MQLNQFEALGEDEKFIASNLPDILEHTRQVVFLESRQMAVVSTAQVQVLDLEGRVLPFQVQQVAWDPVSAEKGEFRHFMEKAIHEQVRSLTDTIAGRVDFEDGHGIRLPELNLSAELALRINKIFITACGTASHAGMVGKILIERSRAYPSRWTSPLSFATGIQSSVRDRCIIDQPIR